METFLFVRTCQGRALDTEEGKLLWGHGVGRRGPMYQLSDTKEGPGNLIQE